MTLDERVKALEERLGNLEVDRDLIWECIWGGKKNELKLYLLLHKEIAGIGSAVYNLQCDSITKEKYKKHLSLIQERVYERIEQVLADRKKTNGKRGTIKYE